MRSHRSRCSRLETVTVHPLPPLVAPRSCPVAYSPDRDTGATGFALRRPRAPGRPAFRASPPPPLAMPPDVPSGVVASSRTGRWWRHED